MMFPQSQRPSVLSHILLGIYLFLISTPYRFLVHAYIPGGIGTYCGSYIENEGLYVLYSSVIFMTDTSGVQGSTNAYMIDLSVNWNTTKPVTKNMKPAPIGGNITCAVLPRHQGWYYQVGVNLYTYDFTKKVWSPSAKRLPLTVDEGRGFAAAVDPNSGIMYIPDFLPPQQPGPYFMMGFTATGGATPYPMPQPLLGRRDYAMDWNAQTKSIIVYSIQATSAPNPSLVELYQYNPLTTQWAALSSVAIPSARQRPCFVSMYGGKKMVLFGGFDVFTTNALRDIYILDVATMTWTQGPDISPMNQRGGAACGSTNDYFVATGGFPSPGAPAFASQTIVFHVKNMTWVNVFQPVPPPIPTTTTTTTIAPTTTTIPAITTTPAITPATTTDAGIPDNLLSSTSGTTDGSSHLIPILGGTVGSLFLVFLVIAGFFWRRARNSRSRISAGNNLKPQLAPSDSHRQARFGSRRPSQSSSTPLTGPSRDYDYGYGGYGYRESHTQPSQVASSESYYTTMAPQPLPPMQQYPYPPVPSASSNAMSYQHQDGSAFGGRDHFSSASRSQTPAAYMPPPHPNPPAPVVMDAYWAKIPVDSPDIKTRRSPAMVVDKSQKYVYPNPTFNISDPNRVFEYLASLDQPTAGRRGTATAEDDARLQRKVNSVQQSSHGSQRNAQHPHAHVESTNSNSRRKQQPFDQSQGQDDVLDDYYSARPYSQHPHASTTGASSTMYESESHYSSRY